MEVLIRDTSDEVSLLGSQIVAQLLRRKPRCVLGLATGRTPLRLYGELIRLHQTEKLDFSQVVTFNLENLIREKRQISGAEQRVRFRRAVRDLAGGQISDGGRDEEGRHPVGAGGEQFAVLAFNDFEPADAASNIDADALRIFSGNRETGGGKRSGAGRKRTVRAAPKRKSR